MRMLRSFQYNLVQGCKSIFRNSVMSTASVLVLLSCMIILGTFYLVLANIEQNVQAIQDLNVIEVRVSSTYSEGQIAEIGGMLDRICKDSDILDDNVLYISSEEHLARFKEQYGGQAWSEFFNEQLNPLRPSYMLTFSDTADIAEVAGIVAQIEEMRFSDGTSPVIREDIESPIELYTNVTAVKRTLTAVGLWLMGILLLISLFVIMNTIKLGVFARRNEVMFMRYCGATKAFIRMPFLVEGAIIGLFSAGIALGLEYLLYTYVFADIVTSTSVMSGGIVLSPYLSHLPQLAVAFGAIGLFAGLLSGSISLMKYLKV